MSYTKEIVEFIKVRLETVKDKTKIAREVVETFKLKKNIDAVRVKVNSIEKDLIVRKQIGDKKRLFFDIETSYITFRGWRTGKQWVDANNIVNDKKIICISYKWQYEDKVHTLQWDKNQNDKKLIKDFIKILGEADEIIAHNGDRFDIKEIRTRAIKEGLLMFPNYRTTDTLKKARKYFNFNSNRLNYLGQFLEVGKKLEHEGFKMWVDIVEKGSKAQLKKMVEYCEQDVLLLEDVYNVLSPYIDHNTNFAVLQGYSKWHCPECASNKVKLHHTDTTPMGWVHRFMKCNVCKKQYKVSNKTYTKYLMDKSNK